MEIIKNLINYEFKKENHYNFKMDIDIMNNEVLEQIMLTEPTFFKLKNRIPQIDDYLMAGNLGDCLLSILNNYNTIINCLIRYKKELEWITEKRQDEYIKNSFGKYYDIIEQKYDYDMPEPLWVTIFSQLENELFYIDKQWSPILLVDLYSFETYMFVELPKYGNELKMAIEQLKKMDNKKYKEQLIELEKQWEEVFANKEYGLYYKYKCIEFIDEYIKNLEKIRAFVDDSFPKISADSNTRIYKKLENEPLKAPKVEPIIGKKNKVRTYSYTFCSLKELCHTTIFHLVISCKKVISRCEYSKCRKYFIAPKSNNIFCPNQNCQLKGKNEKFDNKTLTYQLYKRLKARLLKRINMKDEYNFDYMERREAIENRYHELQKQHTENEIWEDDADFHLYLTEKDIDFQTNYHTLRREYDTKKYWHSDYEEFEIRN